VQLRINSDKPTAFFRNSKRQLYKTYVHSFRVTIPNVIYPTHYIPACFIFMYIALLLTRSSVAVPVIRP